MKALHGRLTKLEGQRPRPVDTTDLDGYLEVLRGELQARGVNPDLAIKDGQIHVFGDDSQYVGTLRAMRATDAILAGRPVPRDCFAHDPNGPDEPLWITHGL